MKILIKLLRIFLGSIIAIVDFVTRGRKMKRSPQAQQQVEAQLKQMALYQFFACPFCIKTRRALHKYNLPIEKRNASEGSPHRDELKQGGGKIQTPCLRIETAQGVEWLYESNAIIDYLQQRFG